MTSGFRMSSGGFGSTGSQITFGASTTTQQQTKPVGFAMPSTATSAASGGLTLGTPGAGGASTGFSLGATPAATTNTGFALGTPATTSGVSTLAGLLNSSVTNAAATPLGLQARSTAAGLTLGATSTATPSTGFSLGGGLGAATGGGLTLGAAATTSTGSSGFSLGGGLGAASGGGLTLGAATATTSTGFNLGGAGGLGATGTAAAGTTGIGFAGGLGGTSKPTLTLGASQPTASSGFGLGAGLTSSAASTTATGIFTGSSIISSTANRGLGGVDPKTTAVGTGATGTSEKTGDSKVVKESQVPPLICSTVEEFEKYVRGQKDIREKSARKSSKPLYRVQENIASLKQMLCLVSNGLQRNAVTIEKMKHESAQELKHVEIAQRTKETPPGLQYENTAPISYFGRMVEEFEMSMILYRQQIEEMENHLTALGHASTLSPQELTVLLRKLYESFVSLAAQLQVVHEAVKVQKEHYLNYRQIFHNDNIDIFEKRKKAQEATGVSVVTTTYGPTPFSGVTSQVAYAMATTLNRPQQPTANAGFNLAPGGFGAGATGTQPTLGGTGTGLFGSTAGAAFGSAFKPATTTASQQSTGFGAGTSFGGFGPSTAAASSTAANTAAARPLGLSFGGTTGGSSLFGAQAATTTASLTSGFAASQPATAGFGSLSAGGFGATPGFGQTDAQGFQLGKPPAGNKRGKKA